MTRWADLARQSGQTHGFQPVYVERQCTKPLFLALTEVPLPPALTRLGGPELPTFRELIPPAMPGVHSTAVRLIVNVPFPIASAMGIWALICCKNLALAILHNNMINPGPGRIRSKNLRNDNGRV